MIFIVIRTRTDLAVVVLVVVGGLEVVTDYFLKHRPAESESIEDGDGSN